MAESRSLFGIVAAVLVVGVAAFLVLWDRSAVDAPEGGVGLVGRGERAGSADGSTADGPLSSDEGAPAALDVATHDDGEAPDYPAVDGVVRGRIVLDDGGPMPVDATIELRLRRPDPWIEDALDDDSFTGAPFDVPRGRQADDATPRSTKELVAAAGLPVDDDAYTNSLRRLDDDVAWHTRTPIDADGWFELRDVPVTGGYLRIRDRFVYVRPGRALTREEFVAARGPDGAPLEVAAERGGVVTGVVSDLAGAPIHRAKLDLTSRFDPWMIFDGGVAVVHVDAARSDADGRYEVRQIPPGHALNLVAEASGHAGVARKVAALGAGEVARVDVALPKGGVIDGRVVDRAGDPVTRGRVFLEPLKVDLMNIEAVDRESDNVPIDADGRFRFADLAAGGYRVVLSSPMSKMTREDLEVVAGAVTEVVLTTAGGLEVSGRVVSTDGAPVVGAEVRGYREPAMMSMRSQVDRRYRPATTTDDDGAFTLGGFDQGGALRVTVEAEGHETTTVDAAAGDDDVVVNLPRRASLSGIVVSLDDGEPIRRFTIGVVPTGGRLALTDLMTGNGAEVMESVRRPATRTSDDGRFHFDDVKPGDWDLYVRADGHAAAFVPVSIPPETHVKGVVVMLQPAAVVTGRVVEAATGLPLEGARITTGSRGIDTVMSELMLGVGAETLTDEDGRFRLGDLAEGTVRVNASHPDHITATTDEVLVVEGETVDVGELALATGAVIEARVVDAFGGPVPDVLVMASEPMGSTIRRDTTDADGRVTLRGLPTATYNVMRLDVSMDVSADNPADMSKDMAWETVEIVDDGVYAVELTTASREGVTLHGRVSSRSGPPPSAMITMIPDRAGMGPLRFGSTDDEGHYEVEGLSPGDYTLQVVPMQRFEDGAGAGGLPTSSVISKVEVTAEPLQTHDVRLPDGVVHGVVRHADSLEPVDDARVVLQRTDPDRPDALVLAASDHRVGETFTGADGTFELRHIPDGTYTVTVGGRNLLGRGDPSIAITRVDDVGVSERGTSFALEIDVAPGGSIRGTVRDTAGRAVAGASLWARDGSGRWLSRLSEVTTDASGSFEVVGLASGAWTLAAAHGNLGFTWVPDVLVDAPGATPVDVVMPPGVQVLVETGDLDLSDFDVEIEGPTGPLPTDLSTLGRLTSLTSGTPSSLLVTVTPGTWRVTLRRGGEVALRETVVLKPGQTRYTFAVPD